MSLSKIFVNNQQIAKIDQNSNFNNDLATTELTFSQVDIIDGSIMKDQSTSTDTNWIRTEFISVVGGSIFKLNLKCDDRFKNIMTLSEYDEYQSLINYKDIDFNDYIYCVPNNVKYVRFSGQSSSFGNYTPKILMNCKAEASNLKRTQNIIEKFLFNEQIPFYSGAIATSGETSDDPHWIKTNYIDISKNNAFIINLNGYDNWGNVMIISYYDSNKQLISYKSNLYLRNYQYIITDPTIKYVRFSGKSASYDYNPYILTNISKYNDVDDSIVIYTESDVELLYGAIAETGETYGDQNWVKTDFIPVMKDDSFMITLKSTNQNVHVISLYDINKKLLSYEVNKTYNSYEYTVEQSNVVYVRFSGMSSTMGSYTPHIISRLATGGMKYDIQKNTNKLIIEESSINAISSYLETFPLPKLNPSYDTDTINLYSDCERIIDGATKQTTSGIDVVFPDANAHYGAFWVRDYAMSLDSDYDFTKEEVLACYNYIKATVPTSGNKAYWVPDHIMLNGGPVWKAGNMVPDPNEDGIGTRASLDGAGFLIKIAKKYLSLNWDINFIQSEIVFLKNAIESIIRENENLVRTETYETTFGFEDGVVHYGNIAYNSIQVYESLLLLKEWAQQTNINNLDFSRIDKVKTEFNEKLVFDIGKKTIKVNNHYIDANLAYVAPCDQNNRGRFDVWITSYAINSGILTTENKIKCCYALLYYKDSYMKYGMAKHVPNEFYQDYDNGIMWQGEPAGSAGVYQRGGYWLTPIYDIISAIKFVDANVAEEMLENAIENGYNTDYPEYIAEDGTANTPLYVSSISYLQKCLNI